MPSSTDSAYGSLGPESLHCDVPQRRFVWTILRKRIFISACVCKSEFRLAGRERITCAAATLGVADHDAALDKVENIAQGRVLRTLGELGPF
jgi:hypothetical protein